MTDQEWATIALLLDKGFKWREPFGEAHERAYRVLLDGCSAEQIAGVLRMLVARGQTFGPTPGEIVELIRRDPARPTFDELVAQLYGPGGVFGFKRSGVEISPWVKAFVKRADREWLRLLPMDDPEQAKWARRDLERSWSAFLEATEGRELAAVGEGRRGVLGRVDPLGAVGGSRRELEPAE